MSHLVDTAQMYLKAILELEEQGIAPLRARLVERLEQSKPTVSETVARLERDGFLKVEDSRLIVLTPEGREQATDVMRKHRLAERLLLDVLNMPWEDVHEEACRWEHVMSDAVEERLRGMLEVTDVDPYGNPIPEVGDDTTAPASEAGLVTLAERVQKDDGAPVVIVRIAEPLQTSPEFLRELLDAGIVPGAEVTATKIDGGVRVAAAATPVNVTTWQSAHLFVLA